MTFVVKTCARGVLTFAQFSVVAVCVLSLAVIAALNCLAARKRSRPGEIPNVLFDRIRDRAA
jgi:hypothetical protein